MHNCSIGKRIQHVREYFKLSRKEFIQIVKVNLSTISRLEANKQNPSDVFLDAMMARFLVNPDWVKTGEGDMLMSVQEYITKGINIIGVQKFGEGLTSIFNDPQFKDCQSYILLTRQVNENLSDDLKEVLQQVMKVWQQGDERTRQVLTQFVKSFSEVEERGNTEK